MAFSCAAAVPVRVKVIWVAESRVATMVRPEGTLAAVTLPADTKLSPLFPVKAVPLKVKVREFEILPSLSECSVNTLPE